MPSPRTGARHGARVCCCGLEPAASLPARAGTPQLIPSAQGGRAASGFGRVAIATSSTGAFSLVGGGVGWPPWSPTGTSGQDGGCLPVRVPPAPSSRRAHVAAGQTKPPQGLHVCCSRRPTWAVPTGAQGRAAGSRGAGGAQGSFQPVRAPLGARSSPAWQGLVLCWRLGEATPLNKMHLKSYHYSDH